MLIAISYILRYKNISSVSVLFWLLFLFVAALPQLPKKPPLADPPHHNGSPKKITGQRAKRNGHYEGRTRDLGVISTTL
jgi:hypothetical protein